MARRQSTQRIEILKSQWLADPCWDIETTEGFEAHERELAAWRYEIESDWRTEEDKRLTTRAAHLGFTPDQMKFIEGLERQIRALRDAFSQHVDGE